MKGEGFSVNTREEGGVSCLLWPGGWGRCPTHAMMPHEWSTRTRCEGRGLFQVEAHDGAGWSAAGYGLESGAGEGGGGELFEFLCVQKVKLQVRMRRGPKSEDSSLRRVHAGIISGTILARRTELNRVACNLELAFGMKKPDQRWSSHRASSSFVCSRRNVVSAESWESTMR